MITIKLAEGSWIPVNSYFAYLLQSGSWRRSLVVMESFLEKGDSITIWLHSVEKISVDFSFGEEKYSKEFSFDPHWQEEKEQQNKSWQEQLRSFHSSLGFEIKQAYYFNA